MFLFSPTTKDYDLRIPRLQRDVSHSQTSHNFSISSSVNSLGGYSGVWAPPQPRAKVGGEFSVSFWHRTVMRINEYQVQLPNEPTMSHKQHSWMIFRITLSFWTKILQDSLYPTSELNPCFPIWRSPCGFLTLWYSFFHQTKIIMGPSLKLSKIPLPSWCPQN